MVYRLNDIDVRLLHVYRAVVECRGFTSAQALLNINQSTISNHISELELNRIPKEHIDYEIDNNYKLVDLYSQIDTLIYVPF